MLGKKRSVSKSTANPFTLSKKQADKRSCSDRHGLTAAHDAVSRQAFWTCVICTRSITNDSFMINNHVNSCLQKTSEPTSDAVKPMEIRSANFARQVGIPVSFADTIALHNGFEMMRGLWLVHEIMSEEEETQMMRYIDDDTATPWKVSPFNGFTDSKTYGVRTQYGVPQEERLVRINNEARNEFPIPTYMNTLLARCAALPQRFPELAYLLKGFQVNECSVNSYEQSKGHFLTPHFDDRALSGPLLLNISMGCAAVMTYTSEGVSCSHRVPLPRRCLQIVAEDARYRWKHSILAEDVLGARRVSLTFREAGGSRGVVSDALKQIPITAYTQGSSSVKTEPKS